MFKKKYLLITLFLIIIFQSLLYTNNKQKTSFRYFKWTLQEVSLGKLISVSFFSGLVVSTLLSSTNISYKNYDLEVTEENDERLGNEEEMKSNFEVPPQRDLRDTQPTISVNYRVVKNTEGNNLKNDQKYSSTFDNNDDWDNVNNDW